MIKGKLEKIEPYAAQRAIVFPIVLLNQEYSDTFSGI